MGHSKWLLCMACCAVTWAGAAWVAEIPLEQNALPLLFHEDFSKGSDRWEATDAGAWKVEVEDGNSVFSLWRTSNYEPPFRSPLNIVRAKDLDVTDFVLDVKMKQTGREYGHRDMCVFFGYVDPAHFYYVHMATKADEHANSIFLVNGAPRVSIAKDRTDGTDWGTGYHKVRVERVVETGSVRVFFDDMGTPIMTAEDKTFLSGGIGFGSFDDTGNIDDVRVWAKKKE